MLPALSVDLSLCARYAKYSNPKNSPANASRDPKHLVWFYDFFLLLFSAKFPISTWYRVGDWCEVRKKGESRPKIDREGQSKRQKGIHECPSEETLTEYRPCDCTWQQKDRRTCCRRTSVSFEVFFPLFGQGKRQRTVFHQLPFPPA